jgi:hypothetical protein
MEHSAFGAWAISRLSKSKSSSGPRGKLSALPWIDRPGQWGEAVVRGASMEAQVNFSWKLKPR